MQHPNQMSDELLLIKGFFFYNGPWHCQIGQGGYVCILPVVKILTGNSEQPLDICRDWNRIWNWSSPEMHAGCSGCWGLKRFIYICHKLYMNQEVMLFIGVIWRLWWVLFCLTIDSLEGNKDSCWLSHLITLWCSRYSTSWITVFYHLFSCKICIILYYITTHRYSCFGQPFALHIMDLPLKCEYQQCHNMSKTNASIPVFWLT